MCTANVSVWDILPIYSISPSSLFVSPSIHPSISSGSSLLAGKINLTPLSWQDVTSQPRQPLNTNTNKRHSSFLPSSRLSPFLPLNLPTFTLSCTEIQSHSRLLTDDSRAVKVLLDQREQLKVQHLDQTAVPPEPEPSLSWCSVRF